MTNCQTSNFEPERYFIPTQEQFVAQQSQAHSPNKNFQGAPQNPYGWLNPLGQLINFGSAAGSSAISNAAGTSNPNLFPFGIGGTTNPGGYQPPQPQFFGGTFGLGFGFGGGWYPPPYTALSPFPNVGPSFQQQPLHSIQQQSAHSTQQQQSSASASAQAQAQAGFLQNTKPIDVQVSNQLSPILLKPSYTGWETSYNVPCGTYVMRPFVLANLRLATSSTPFKRRRRSPFRFDYESTDDFQSGLGNPQRHLPQFYYPFPLPPSPAPTPITGNNGKTCSWSFYSDGQCKLKFKCVWFQLPALFRCSENLMQVTDGTVNLNSTFCGNRKPRKVYNSSNGRIILTFKSQPKSLPAVFDCAVTCGPFDSVNAATEQKPERKVIVPTREENNFSTSTTERDQPYNHSTATTVTTLTTSNVTEGTAEKSRVRIGDCKCGVQDDHYLSKGRIVGGSPANPVEFLWNVALVRKSSYSASRPFCSGSLISDRYVISAAHCVSNNMIIREPRATTSGRSSKDLFDVLLLEHDINRLDEIPGGSIRSAVDKIIVHPLYDNVTFNYDVALIRLATPIDVTSDQSFYQSFDFDSQRRRFLPEVQARPFIPKPVPICLPSDKETQLEDKYGTIVGWGLKQETGGPSNELLKATVQIFNDSLCKEIYKEYNYPVTDTMFCAGYLGGQVDACVGDSGGGLIMKSGGKYSLVGVTSWGRGCGRKKQPGVYTKIPGLMEWIMSEANDGIWCV